MSLKILPIRKSSEFNAIGNSGQKFFLKNLIVITKPTASFYLTSSKKNLQKTAIPQDTPLDIVLGNSQTNCQTTSQTSNHKHRQDIDISKKTLQPIFEEIKTISSQQIANNQKKQIFCRAGFTVSKNISKLANIRNLVKRRLREALKANVENLSEYQDYIFIARKDILKSQYQELVKDMAFALQQIKKNNQKHVNTSKPRK
ncbi:MAG: ribonuclease P protein component [Alphaproteobacteria bacterium]